MFQPSDQTLENLIQSRKMCHQIYCCFCVNSIDRKGFPIYMKPNSVSVKGKDMLFRYEAPLLKSLYILMASLHTVSWRSYKMSLLLFVTKIVFFLLLFVALKKAIYVFIIILPLFSGEHFTTV